MGMNSKETWIILLEWERPRWSEYCFSIAERLKAEGKKPIVVDIRQFKVPRKTWLRNYLPGSRLRTHKKLAKELAVDYEMLRRRGLPSKMLGDNKIDIAQADFFQSELETIFRTDSPEDINLRKFYMKRLHKAAAFFKTKLLETIDRHQPHGIVIPNGRFSLQQTAMQIAEKRQLNVLFYESNRFVSKSSYYFDKYSVHSLDRLRNVLTTESYLNHLDQARLLLGRISQNQFTKGRQLTMPRSYLSRGKLGLVSIFTSSPDEYSGIGHEYNSGYEDQWDFYREFILLTDPAKCEILIRLHPNLLSKNSLARKRQIRKAERLSAEFRHITIVGDSSPMSSSSLLALSDLVVIWNSTIGLEALHSGTPVYKGAPAWWQASQTEEYFSAEFLARKISVLRPEIKGEKHGGALAAVAGRFAECKPITVSSQEYQITNWDSWVPPLHWLQATRVTRELNSFGKKLMARSVGWAAVAKYHLKKDSTSIE